MARRKRRRLAMQVLGIQGLPRVEGMQGVYADAYRLLERIYANKRWSRGYMSSYWRLWWRMPESRWRKARQLLVLAGVLQCVRSERGGLAWRRAPSRERAEALLLAKAEQIRRECERNKWYVSPI